MEKIQLRKPDGTPVVPVINSSGIYWDTEPSLQDGKIIFGDENSYSTQKYSFEGKKFEEGPNPIHCNIDDTLSIIITTSNVGAQDFQYTFLNSWEGLSIKTTKIAKGLYLLSYILNYFPEIHLTRHLSESISPSDQVFSSSLSFRYSILSNYKNDLTKNQVETIWKSSNWDLGKNVSLIQDNPIHDPLPCKGYLNFSAEARTITFGVSDFEPDIVPAIIKVNDIKLSPERYKPAKGTIFSELILIPETLCS